MPWRRMGEWMYRSTFPSPRQRYPSTHLIKGWVGPRTGLHAVERRKSYSYRDSNTDHSAFQPVARRYTGLRYPGRYWIQISAKTSAILTEVFRRVPLLSPGNSTRSQQLSSKSTPIHFILPFGNYSAHRASLNKPLWPFSHTVTVLLYW
jgi:hypothetical protein